jgi:hypothetical protein
MAIRRMRPIRVSDRSPRRRSTRSKWRRRIWGTSLGLATDEHARVLDANRNPIPGLYACGNDMNSIMGGQYPAPGVTLGPALTFAYVAALHAAGKPAVADVQAGRSRSPK